MSRRIRPNCPGLPFHLTARIQAREPLLRGVEDQVVALIIGCAAATDVRLLAYAVMPNHLHIVTKQGSRELRDFMQPLLRRVALLTQRHHRREGHVFERRYSAFTCRDPAYFRNTIVYVHLNPVRAGLCVEPEQYPWTSHGMFTDASDEITTPLSTGIHDALQCFITRDGGNAEEWRASYGSYVAWRQRMDRCDADPARRAVVDLDKPCTDAGDRHWSEAFGAAASDGPLIPGRRLDLRDLALRSLTQLAPDMGLDLLRSGGRARPLVTVRQQFIVRALSAGHRPGTIAKFLNVSSTTVSSARLPQ